MLRRKDWPKIASCYSISTSQISDAKYLCIFRSAQIGLRQFPRSPDNWITLSNSSCDLLLKHRILYCCDNILKFLYPLFKFKLIAGLHVSGL